MISTSYPPTSYVHHPYTCKTTRKLRNKVETDRWTDMTDCIIFPANAVGKKVTHPRHMYTVRHRCNASVTEVLGSPERLCSLETIFSQYYYIYAQCGFRGIMRPSFDAMYIVCLFISYASSLIFFSILYLFPHLLIVSSENRSDR